MTQTVRVAVPRKGRPLEAVLERFATTESIAQVADDITSTLRFEKSVTKAHTHPEHDVYERLAEYSDLADPTAPEYTLLRDDRDGMPRRIVFDSVVFELDGVNIHLVGREEPFRALRTHEFGLGFDSADLVLEEVVKLQPDGLGSIDDVNSRIDPMDTDVRVVSGLGDTVYHTLMADPEILPPGADLDRDFVADYAGDLCISPRYERLVEAVLGTRCLDDVTFAYPNGAPEEEAAIADAGLGVYLTMTGSTAREHGLVLGEHLFPSETVLMENVAEATPAAETVKRAISSPDIETALTV
ncbi:hypothetical protein C440_00515 [Haloferax mucosum ATCC BAA-1512]|uniref:ATP phosphoribosyltransferase n=1 Tax=Haloferax mucosum ATCC BAA-1512 TaxID=662479 RepID=M0ISK0_9EURY|nr:hypothetical protein [Haloferax mucosum]ELZ98793.1 hypothetical protein C440_00515 [Haloferax mucosum ATCC BAA-1512]